jgi:ferric-dicitrate binding protein FerR (iron transport regulator)
MKRITDLMQRFLEGKASKEECRKLMQLVNSRRHDKLFLNAWDELLEKNLEARENADEKLTAIVQNVRKNFDLHDYEFIRTLTANRSLSVNRTRRRFVVWSAAAAILLLFSVTYIAKNYLIPERPPQLTQALIEPGIKGATLIMDDGTVVSLSDTTHFSLEEKDGTLIQKESGSINYKSQEKSKTEKEIFNTIITTTGEEYTLQLSDGTQVHLNAESEIRFPVKFSKARREVSVKGEAYFVVTKDAKRPFTAKTAKMDIRVLGTQFNVNAYGEENTVRTTLVEGSLEVLSLITHNSSVIQPGQQASIDETGELEINNVNTKLYTDWIDGKFIFVNERLEDIIIKLRRWYNIEVEYADESVKDIRFGARLNRYTQVNTIFEIMNNTRLVNIVQTKNKFMIRQNN